MQETPVQFLGQEDPLEKGKTTHSSVLAYSPWGCKESNTTKRLSAAQHSDCQILRILTKYGNLVALAHRRYTVLHNVMGMEEIIRNKSVHLQFNWKERGPEGIT